MIEIEGEIMIGGISGVREVIEGVLVVGIVDGVVDVGGIVTDMVDFCSNSIPFASHLKYSRQSPL